ncbi:zinc finger CCCH domain-containing protein 15-like [Macadamia integrifolia]|uniref:zinc finger CCCH domain-containing protein 15-like n=1 Tax=Macadamia integrifolia TaxID=60698 RepID=UPI001C4EDFB2|nr:zinc finger CCCH domain-containing protein 15-like [Macadamia integrifolia]
MQNDKSPTDDGISSSASTLSQDQRLPSQNRQSEGIGFTSLCSSSFPTKASVSNSVSLSPSGCSCDEDKNEIATENRLYLARVTLEYDQLLDRYRLCYSHLHEALKEVEAFRQEIAELRIENRDLNNRLRLLAQTSLQNRFIPSSFPSPSLINDFRRLCLGDHNTPTSCVSSELLDESPTSVIGNNPFERRSLDRGSLPKSISIRSSGYLKLNQTSGSSNGASSATSRLRVASPVDTGTQRVYVAGSSELEAFNQGMLKTELCNKWQETGTCPYGDHCQFAHGISELRPVIRHPRYKTEVCRMVLAGDNCPYGHRCHFRHALTEQERFMAEP